MAGIFNRPWFTDAQTGYFRDGVDGRPFSTEFSHSRFLIPALSRYKGWALFMDCDMLFQADIDELIEQADDSKAVMCVKHNHKPLQKIKMDGVPQTGYNRKNWSSFVMWNCAHPKNKGLTTDMVNARAGSYLHGFEWLDDNDIGALDHGWNWLAGDSKYMQDIKVIHYTNGGPWFGESKCVDVPYADKWIAEYEHMQRNGRPEGMPYHSQPTVAYEV